MGENPYGARISGAELTGVAATTLLKHYGKFSRTLDADRAERAKIDGEGGTDCPTVAHQSFCDYNDTGAGKLDAKPLMASNTVARTTPALVDTRSSLVWSP